MRERNNVVPMEDYDSTPHSVDDAGQHSAGPAAGGRGRPKREKRKPQPNVGNLNRLFGDFAYQYGSEVAWDTVHRLPIRISHLRHTFGHDAVKLWMGSEKRRMVMPEQVPTPVMVVWACAAGMSARVSAAPAREP